MYIQLGLFPVVMCIDSLSDRQVSQAIYLFILFFFLQNLFKCYRCIIPMHTTNILSNALNVVLFIQVMNKFLNCADCIAEQLKAGITND